MNPVNPFHGNMAKHLDHVLTLLSIRTQIAVSSLKPLQRCQLTWYRARAAQQQVKPHVHECFIKKSQKLLNLIRSVRCGEGENKVARRLLLVCEASAPREGPFCQQSWM